MLCRNQGIMWQITAATTFHCYRKCLESVIGTNKIVFCWRCAYTFSNSTKEFFNVQGKWHSPDTLPIIVHNQAVHIITWQHHRERVNSLPSFGDPLGFACMFYLHLFITLHNVSYIYHWLQSINIVLAN